MRRGNVAFFWLRFHALVKIPSDYQRVTKHPVAASRRGTLTGAFWQWFGCAPAGVGPLEVRFAHPVRLSPDTHSQGHGRPCLQRSHPRQGFSATWSLLMVISFHAMPPVRIKTFSTHVVAKIERNVSRKRFSTHERHGGHGSHGLGVVLVSSAVSG